MSIQDDIVLVAEFWAKSKVRYIHRGTTMNGCDCSGLLIGIMQSLGYLKDFQMPVYPFDWNIHGAKYNFLTESLPKYANKVDNYNRQPGDILLFRFGKQISHAGILIRDNLFVHCYYPVGVCYGILNSEKWGKRLVEVWRLDTSKEAWQN